MALIHLFSNQNDSLMKIYFKNYLFKKLFKKLSTSNRQVLLENLSKIIFWLLSISHKLFSLKIYG